MRKLFTAAAVLLASCQQGAAPQGNTAAATSTSAPAFAQQDKSVAALDDGFGLSVSHNSEIRFA
ncbi:hypothetical protein [Sphingomonas sp.]|uniref:hypothetical protein n=1 Tax=Sphingomonas sp. TaxID=28214 RepID=UPI003750B556